MAEVYAIVHKVFQVFSDNPRMALEGTLKVV